MFAFSLCLLLVSLPFLSYQLIFVKRKQLASEDFERKFSRILADLKTKNATQRPFFSVFLVHRLFFALTIVVMVRFGVFSLSALVLSIAAFLGYHFAFMPYQSTLSKHLSVINLLHCLIYYLMVYPLFVEDLGTGQAASISYAMLGVVCSCIAVNWGYIVYSLGRKLVEKIKEKRQGKKKARRSATAVFK